MPSNIMTLKENLFFKKAAIVLPLFISTTIISPCLLNAQASATDSIGKKLLAMADTKASPTYITKASNVIFPDILKGNEEQSIDYIENFSKRRKDYLVRMYTKGKKILPKAANILKKYKLPEELRILLVLESAYNGNVVSRAGAVGYWQIMDAVAKEYGLTYAKQLTPDDKKKLEKEKGMEAAAIIKKLEKEKDDRKNFIKSSTAAARYLRDRRLNLDDNLLLMVASYNCGVGNVWQAMERSGKKNPTFWDIKKYLPEETKAYVMNFITLNVIFKNYENFSKNKLQFAPVKIEVPDNFEQNINNELNEVSAAATLK
jgi:hypothetical protein